MVWDLLVSSWLSSIAGLTLALVTALLTDYRERQRWLRAEVYQPMYDELANVLSGETPWTERGYTSKWADLAYYKVYRVDVELAEVLDRYASRISELAGADHSEDVEAFVRALPDSVCDGEDGVAELPSGWTIDMRTWFRRNVLLLSTDPAFQAGASGFEPAELDYLWTEVDGIPPDGGRLDTAEILEAVSIEFNWGYEGCYHHWDDGWEGRLVGAALDAAQRSDSRFHELLCSRRAVGDAANEAKSLIEDRAVRGLFRGLYYDWFAGAGGGSERGGE